MKMKKAMTSSKETRNFIEVMKYEHIPNIMRDEHAGRTFALVPCGLIRMNHCGGTDSTQGISPFPIFTHLNHSTTAPHCAFFSPSDKVLEAGPASVRKHRALKHRFLPLKGPLQS